MIFGIECIYFWMIILIVCVAVEAATFSLISIWFAVGSIAALIAAAAGASVIVQLIVFIIISTLLLASLRSITTSVLKIKRERTNADRIIGQIAIVTEQIDNERAVGQVRLMGQLWSARSSDDSVISNGEKVKILAISGVKAIVEKTEKNN